VHIGGQTRTKETFKSSVGVSACRVVGREIESSVGIGWQLFTYVNQNLRKI
jgi:hypothetical protein